jgi:hypothetical protein
MVKELNCELVETPKKIPRTPSQRHRLLLDGPIGKLGIAILDLSRRSRRCDLNWALNTLPATTGLGASYIEPGAQDYYTGGAAS